jgi:hypothetical protein
MNLTSKMATIACISDLGWFCLSCLGHLVLMLSKLSFITFSNLLDVSKADQGYSRNILLLPKICFNSLAFQSFECELLDDGYSRNVLWAYLKHILCTILDDGYSRNISCALYLMTVILETYLVHYTWWRLF